MRSIYRRFSGVRVALSCLRSVSTLNSTVCLPLASVRNRALLALIGLATMSAFGWAQTFSSVNGSNAALGGNLVVDDAKMTTITGLAAGAAINVLAYQNGQLLACANVGNADGNGNWSVTGHATLTSVGNREDIWFEGGLCMGNAMIGGMQIADNMYIIFDKPTGLSVVSVSASSPDFCGSSYVVNGVSLRTLTYGPSASIQYQITGGDGSVSAAASLFEPQESINGAPASDIGCDSGSCPTNWQWTPPSAKFASQSGTFYDVPVDWCYNAPFNYANAFGTQAISIKIGNTPYAVRSQTFSVSSSSPGHGTLRNNLGDITLNQ